MDPIVVAAASAVVGAMATDAWTQAKAAVVSLWRRVRPEQVTEVEAALGGTRAEIVRAREAEDVEAERALISSWQARLQEMQRADPAFTAQLQQLVLSELKPTLPTDEQARIGAIVMNATARSGGRVYQAGRDMHVTEP